MLKIKGSNILITKLIKQTEILNETSIISGISDAHKYPDGTPVAEVATNLEFGSESVKNNLDKYEEQMADIVVNLNDIDVNDEMNELGRTTKSDMIKSFADTAKSDTGQMVRSINYRVIGE